MRALAANAATKWLPQALCSVPVDMRMLNVPGSGDGCVGPIAITTTSGQIAVRRVPANESYALVETMRPVSDRSADEQQRDKEMLALFQAACDGAAASAPRFKPLPGQALLLENYRVMHGREPFQGERLLYRTWIWTQECNGVPSSIQGSFVGTQRDARGVRQFGLEEPQRQALSPKL